MTNSQIATTEGSGKNIASYSFSETTTKELQRNTLNKSDGTEIGVAAQPLQVSLANTAANSTAVKVDNSAVTQPVAGDVASGSSDSGNPVKIGGKAINAEATAVTNGQRVNLVSDLVGKQIVMPYANPENFVAGVTAAITDTTSTSTIAAEGSGVRTYITSILVTNSHATVGTFVKILDGASIVWEGYAAALGGGFSQSFPVPLRCTANTAVNTQCVTTGANVIASIAGYKGV